MYARISEFRGEPGKTAEEVRLARQQILPAAWLQEGFAGMLLLSDSGRGRSLAVTLWYTEEDMKQSEEAVRNARAESAVKSGEKVASVERYEVALCELAPFGRSAGR